MQTKDIKKDYAHHFDEYGDTRETDFAILVECLLGHLDRLQELGNSSSKLRYAITELENNLIESIPKDVISFSSDDGKWRSFIESVDGEEYRHVYPINDLIEHELHGVDCPCNVNVITEDGFYIVVHDAIDGRHLTERKNEK